MSRITCPFSEVHFMRERKGLFAELTLFIFWLSHEVKRKVKAPRYN